VRHAICIVAAALLAARRGFAGVERYDDASSTFRCVSTDRARASRL
jgi:hypothetical protein